MQAADPIPSLSVVLVAAVSAAMLLSCLACSGETDAGVAATAAAAPEAATVTGASGLPAPATHESAGASGKAWFVNAGPECGVTHRNLSGPTVEQGKYFLLDCIGPGVAAFDFDADGDLDLYFPQGRADSDARRAADADDATGGDCAARLYRNLGARRFQECAAESGLAARGYGFGALAFDYDGDADDDLLVTNFGPDQLFRNDGGRFTDVTAEHPGLEGAPDDWTTGAAAADVDRDGDLDLYVCNYIRHDKAALQAKGLCQFMGACRVPCGPLGLEPERAVFFRNSGAPEHRLVPDTAAAGLEMPAAYGFQPLFTDIDDDGDLDLYVSNDSVPNHLFVNDGSGHFSESALLAGVATGPAGQMLSGMGVASGDLNGDGLPELYVTNFSTQHNSLYINQSRAMGRLWFDEQSVRTGCGHPTWFRLAWGCALADFDDDGWLDIFVADGHVYPQVDGCAPSDITYRQTNLLFRGLPGETPRFEDASATSGEAFTVPGPHRGSAAADLDEDGDLDLVVVRLDEPPLLAWNETAPRGHWLSVLPQLADGRRAIGAQVVAESGGRRWVGETRAGSSFLSSEDPRVHFGLGDHARLDRLAVRFPDGSSWSATNVSADRHLVVRAGIEEPAIVAGPGGKP